MFWLKCVNQNVGGTQPFNFGYCNSQRNRKIIIFFIWYHILIYCFIYGKTWNITSNRTKYKIMQYVCRKWQCTYTHKHTLKLDESFSFKDYVLVNLKQVIEKLWAYWIVWWKIWDQIKQQFIKRKLPAYNLNESKTSWK
jgi:hypothetical protein